MDKARACVDCGKPAQTKRDHRDGGWSPYFCKECDEQRIARIDKSLSAMAAKLGQAKEGSDG